MVRLLLGEMALTATMSLESIGTRRAFSTVSLITLQPTRTLRLTTLWAKMLSLFYLLGRRRGTVLGGPLYGASGGFFYNGSTYTPIIDPLAGTGQYGATNACGIDGNNIVGGYVDGQETSRLPLQHLQAIRTPGLTTRWRVPTMPQMLTAFLATILWGVIGTR